ncbi:hypothetical protein NQ315_014679 [Exocentrus adspersus]|uniref:Transposase n=1 Tax=Exocentrus adspersus TaxID=1586481 RepID=A0AAV8VR24_9CUCU|nr:hypothetical protein NQ315_014679 [Exocentrus adspersus]
MFLSSLQIKVCEKRKLSLTCPIQRGVAPLGSIFGPIVFNATYPNLPPMGRISAERIVPKPVTSDQDNVINVLVYFNAYPEASTRAAEYDLGISRCSIHKILRANNMHPYKFTPVSELHPNDAVPRMEFCEMILVKMQEDPEFLRNIIWTDESKFTREVTQLSVQVWGSVLHAP